jgi:thiamine pyrophosphate-dependent acetolactate synthase large subunit-like protein
MTSTNLGQVRPGADPPDRDGSPRTVSDVIVDVLANAGVRRIYGVTGDALNAFVDALRKDGRIEWVAVRHEETAAFAAYGEAELTGGIGVCAGTVGPGALHLLNGLYNAKREGAGVVAITGQVARELRGRSYFQEVDLGKVFDDVCGMQVAIEDPSQLALTAEMAVRHAIWQRDVVRIELPVDVTTLDASGRAPGQRLTARPQAAPPDLDALAAAASVIDRADRVTVLAGAGCRGAEADVLALAEHLAAPVAHTLKARGMFDFREGHVVGLTGLIGMPAGYHAVRDCDALLMLGTDFPYEEFYPERARVVQVDVRADHIGRRVPVDVGVVGDAGGTARALREQTARNRDDRWLRRHQRLRDRWVRRDERRVEPDGRGALDPRLVTRAAVADGPFLHRHSRDPGRALHAAAPDPRPGLGLRHVEAPRGGDPRARG